MSLPVQQSDLECTSIHFMVVSINNVTGLFWQKNIQKSQFSAHNSVQISEEYIVNQ